MMLADCIGIGWYKDLTFLKTGWFNACLKKMIKKPQDVLFCAQTLGNGGEESDFLVSLQLDFTFDFYGFWIMYG